MRLGYLVPEFPSQTHVFFWQEVQALRSMAERVMLVSTRRPPIDSTRHEFKKQGREETHYLFPPALENLLHWPQFIGRTRRASSYIWGLEEGGVRARMRHLGLLACAVDLVRWSQREQIDHIHGHSCADAAHILALSHAMGGAPYSLTLHGDLDVYGVDHISKTKAASFVCVVGEHLKQQLLQATGIETSRIVKTFMGVETAEFALLGKERKFKTGTLKLTTVARLNRMKGHEHAISAVHAARKSGFDIHYTIAGEGPHRSAISKCVKNLSLQDHVTLTGTLSRQEVCQLLNESDAFILPSTGKGEAWPVSVMEAMAAGLPVIASRIGATTEMITPGYDGILVSQGDERSLEQNLVLLASDIGVRKRLGRAARQTALSRFDVAATSRVLRDAIIASR